VLTAPASKDHSTRDTGWEFVYALDAARKPSFGNTESLASAIRRGADLRVYSQFRNNEHLDPRSTNREIIEELMDFRVTYLLDDRWVAGIINMRQPISLPDGFGTRPSMSFFLYNQDGKQALARPHLDGRTADYKRDEFAALRKYHSLGEFDVNTRSPSKNFIYDFEILKFFVYDGWREATSVDELAHEFAQGRYIKAGIAGICFDVGANTGNAMPHELFVECGSCYYYTEQKLFVAGTHPVVRVKPAIPLGYGSGCWDFGWLMLRSDGLVVRRLVDPMTMKFQDSRMVCQIRWFVR
jgi:hypothetical protein